MKLKITSKTSLYLTPWVYGVIFLTLIFVADKFFKPNGPWSSTANVIGDILFYLLFISGFLAFAVYAFLTKNNTSYKTVLIQFFIQSINMCVFWFTFFYIMIGIFGFPKLD
jgi:hypothetical protein